MKFDTLISRLNLLVEGGAAGHMAHPYELSEVNNGEDLINIFKKLLNPSTESSNILKVDGINITLKVVTNKNTSELEFAIDRGSGKMIDIEGVTIDRLEERFGSGHGMVDAGNTILPALNESLSNSKILSLLKSLGVVQTEQSKFNAINTEYVNKKTNVKEYDVDFIMFHNIIKFQNDLEKKKRSSSFDNSKNADLSNLAKLLNPYLEKINFNAFGNVDVNINKDTAKNINIDSILSINTTLNINKKGEKKSLKSWLSEVSKNYAKDRPSYVLNNGKKTASNGLLYSIATGKNEEYKTLKDALKTEEDLEKAKSTVILMEATRLIGVKILESSSVIDMFKDKFKAEMNKQEGMVIKVKDINNGDAFKITGDFIIDKDATSFGK